MGERVPTVTIVDANYPGRKGDADVKRRAETLAAQLSKASGQTWTVGRVVSLPEKPQIGTALDLGAVLDKTNTYADGQVWVFGDGTLGGQEAYLSDAGGPLYYGGNAGTANYDPKRAPVPLRVHVFNTERSTAEDLHTLGHSLEMMALHGDPEGLKAYTGRPDPWGANLTPQGGTVAAAGGGYGTIHVPPNATRPYQYDGPGSEKWGGTQDGYMAYWLANAPRHWWKALDGEDAAAGVFDLPGAQAFTAPSTTPTSTAPFTAPGAAGSLPDTRLDAAPALPPTGAQTHYAFASA